MRVRCRVRALMMRVLMRSRCWAKLTYSVDGGGRGGRRVKQEGWRRTISNGSPLRCTTELSAHRGSPSLASALSRLPSRSPTLAAFAASLSLSLSLPPARCGLPPAATCPGLLSSRRPQPVESRARAHSALCCRRFPATQTRNCSRLSFGCIRNPKRSWNSRPSPVLKKYSYTRD